MRVISKRRLREFWEDFPEAEQPLSDWYDTARRASWSNFSEVRTTFRRADVYRDCIVFDIGGNKFRLIVKIRYKIQRIYIRFVLTHKEYNKDKWKSDCRC